jgi:hypothetical protein
LKYAFDPEQLGAARLREQALLLREDLTPTTVEVVKPFMLPGERTFRADERATVLARLTRMLVSRGSARL